jgi:hypothetical protein
MKTHTTNKGFEVSGGTIAVTPTFSPRRGRIIRCLTQCRVAEKSSVTIDQTEVANGCSLSPRGDGQGEGERKN